MLSELFERIFTPVHAEEPTEEAEPETPAEEEEEEEEEPEDQMPIIAEECGKTAKCSPAKHHLHECEERVAKGSSENCVEELFHFMHCVDECAAPKIFATLK